ncbi:hypothetical protein XELAEV_18001984mg [Xenopus laevis]|nr:hypothetical protein XELAEV_18001984mg [Xenopus laevis]
MHIASNVCYGDRKKTFVFGRVSLRSWKPSAPVNPFLLRIDCLAVTLSQTLMKLHILILSKACESRVPLLTSSHAQFVLLKLIPGPRCCYVCSCRAT